MDRKIDVLIEKYNTGQISRRGFLRLAAGLVGSAAAASIAAACGPAAQPTATSVPPTATPMPPTPTSVPPTPTPAPKPQIFTHATQVDIYNLDPATGHDGIISETQKNVYNALFRHVGSPAQVVPELAESYEVSDDAMEWVFKLHRNAVFHDGSPVTSEAVKFSLDRIRRIKKGVFWMFDGLVGDESLTTPDDYTVKVVLEKPYAPFLHAMTWLFVLNPKLVTDNAGDDDTQTWLTSHEAGSGPFTIKRFEPSELFEFEAWPDYWGGWRKEGRLSGYIVRVVREPSTRIQLLETGEADMIDWVPPDDIVRLKDDPKYYTTPVGIGYYGIKMNNARGYTSDIHVRRAISYAFDYEALVALFGGLAIPTGGPLSPNLAEYADDIEPYVTDIEKAKEELAKSQWPDGGFELEFAYVQGLEEERLTGEIMLDQLSKLNIKVNIKPELWADAVARFKDPETSPDMFPVYSGTDYPVADNFLWQAYHSSMAGFWAAASHYKNPELDAILEEARATPDQAKSKELYRQAQHILIRDAADVFGISRGGNRLYRSWVKGFEFCPVMGSPGWRDIYIEGRPT